MYKIAVDLISSMVMAYVFAYCAETIFSVRDKKKEMTLTIIFGFLILLISSISMEVKFFSLPILFIILVKLIFKFSFRDAIISSILTYMCIIVSDILTGLFLTEVLLIPTMHLKDNLLISLFASIMTSLIAMGIIFVIRKRKYIISNKVHLDKKRSFVTTLYILITFILIAINSIVYAYMVESTNVMVLLVGTITCIIFFVLNFVFLKISNDYVKQKIEIEEQRNEYTQLQAYTDVIEELVSGIKNFKHDYKNVLISIDGYIQDEDMDGLSEYFSNELIKQGSKLSTNESILELHKVKNPGVKGLLTAKYYTSVDKEVKLSTIISEEIEDINIKTIDVCRILGVLIDNALEAAEESESKKVVITFAKKEDELSIIIMNTYKELIPIHEMFEEGRSSKGDNRGRGLSNVKSILDNDYPNAMLNTTITDEYFIQELILQTEN